jgi:hypothetical protein
MKKLKAPKGNFVMKMPVPHPTYKRVGRYEGIKFFIDCNNTLIVDKSCVLAAASKNDWDAFMIQFNTWLKEETA